jgi:hypothetical protein
MSLDLSSIESTIVAVTPLALAACYCTHRLAQAIEQAFPNTKLAAQAAQIDALVAKVEAFEKAVTGK